MASPVAIVIAVSEAHDLAAVARECRAQGLWVTETLTNQRLLIGNVDPTRIKIIAAIPGVVDIDVPNYIYLPAEEVS